MSLSAFEPGNFFVLFHNGGQYLNARTQARTDPQLKAFAADIIRQSPNKYQRSLSSRWTDQGSGSISTAVFSPSNTNSERDYGASRNAAASAQTLERLAVLEEAVAVKLTPPLSPDEAHTKTTSPSLEQDHGMLPWPNTAPPSYTDLVLNTVESQPIGTMIGQMSTNPPTESHDINVSKTVVGVMGVLVGAAVCSAM